MGNARRQDRSVRTQTVGGGTWTAAVLCGRDLGAMATTVEDGTGKGLFVPKTEGRVFETRLGCLARVTCEKFSRNRRAVFRDLASPRNSEITVRGFPETEGAVFGTRRSVRAAGRAEKRFPETRPFRVV